MNDGKLESDAEIASAWVRVQRAENGSADWEGNFWAAMLLDDLRSSDVERFWRIILEMKLIDDSDFMLANIGAGPLEDLLVYSGDLFIDRIEGLARTDERFKTMLGMVWRNHIPAHIWGRVQVAAGSDEVG